MARCNFQDCKYFIYAHYNNPDDVNDPVLRSALKRWSKSRFEPKECGFITGARDSIELDYLVRLLDSSRNIDYTILEQMNIWDIDG